MFILRPATGLALTTLLVSCLSWVGCDIGPSDLAGDSNQPITFAGPMPRWISFSPLGDAIVFEQNGMLVIGRGADLKDARSISGRGAYQHPTWSPDGRYVAYDYTRDRYHPANLWVRPADMSEIPRRVTDIMALDSNPQWSADGDWIAFYSRRSPGNHVWAVPAAGGEPFPLGEALSGDGGLDWAPEGATLAYEGLEGNQVDIWAANPRSKAIRRLAGTPAVDSHPVWRPDGDAIAFMARINGETNVWTQQLPGGNSPSQLTSIGGISSFDWLPDGRSLMFVTTDRKLYAQLAEPGAPPMYMRDAVAFAVPRRGERYAYVVPVETYFRYYADNLPPDL